MGASVSNRTIRRVLWFFGWIVCFPVSYWGLVDNQSWISIPALVAGCVSIYFSLQKRVCPSCGNGIRVVGYEATHCMKCGTPYGTGNAGPPRLD